MPPLSYPYQDRINMEQFKVQEDAFNNRGGYFSEPLSVGQPVAPIFSDPVADDAGTAPRSTIMGYGGGSTSEQIDPYVQEVQQITDRTFPNFTGFGALGGQMSSPMDNSRSFSNISQAMGSRSSFASSPYKMS